MLNLSNDEDHRCFLFLMVLASPVFAAATHHHHRHHHHHHQPA